MQQGAHLDMSLGFGEGWFAGHLQRKLALRCMCAAQALHNNLGAGDRATTWATSSRAAASAKAAEVTEAAVAAEATTAATDTAATAASAAPAAQAVTSCSLQQIKPLPAITSACLIHNCSGRCYWV